MTVILSTRSLTGSGNWKDTGSVIIKAIMIFIYEEKAKRRLLQAAVPSSAPVQRKAAPEPISSTVKSSGRHKRAYSPQEAEKLLAKVELSIREQEALLGVLEGRMADPASHTDPEASAALAGGACCPASGNREADAALGRTDDSGRSVTGVSRRC